MGEALSDSSYSSLVSFISKKWKSMEKVMEVLLVTCAPRDSILPYLSMYFSNTLILFFTLFFSFLSVWCIISLPLVFFLE